MTVSRTMRIINVKGLHARASRKLAELALSYDHTRITVRRENEEADARSLMELITLGAGVGEDIEVEARGPQAEEALDAVEQLINNKFQEGE